jgi:FtsP/CotA-like multicopper oxidase with cupredoxin domain
MAQRLDLHVDLPDETAAFPIFAKREGDRQQTGVVLATPGAAVAMLPTESETAAPPVLLQLERRLVASEPLIARPVDRALTVRLTGSMAGYEWGIDGRPFEERLPVAVALGERVEVTMVNETMMSHPMHLHGHHFQVVGLGPARLPGAMRDTVLVPPMEGVTIAFDADNPGDWPFHCHNLYHMAAGMMTTVRYV